MGNVMVGPHEAERLQTLREYDLLDRAPALAFERIAQIASKVLDMPVALVTFIDENQQHIKACAGAELSDEILVMERSSSFCTHTILSDEVFVVANTQNDRRFADNHLVVGAPRVRFYAGAPLRAPNGHNLGSLCVLDTVPRTFDEEQQKTLSDLAAIVMDEIEMRRIGRDLREREAALALALEENDELEVVINNLHSGVVIADPHQPDNPITFANPAFYEMTLYSPEEVIGFNCRFLQGPDTDPQMVREIREAVAQRRPLTRVLRNYRKDGTPFDNELTVNPVFDDEGKLLSLVGLQNDVTEREQAKRLLEERVEQRTAELRESKIEILTRLARAAEFRDDETGQHTQRVAFTAALVARELGLSEEHVEWIYQAAPLHDVGKISVSDLILLKPGKLTDEEFEIMKTHTTVGSVLLSKGQSEVMKIAERIAGSHHERWDGKGYPRGLAGTEIPLEARILSVADVFDALTHERPYKKAWSIAAAVAEIHSQSGRQFDPAVVEAFLKLPQQQLVECVALQS